MRDRVSTPAPVALSSVELRDGFWMDWRRRLGETTLDHVADHLETSGRFDAFRRLGGNPDVGIVDGGGDAKVHKWLEASSYLLNSMEDTTPQSRVETVVSQLVAAQSDSGYLVTDILLGDDEPWTNLTQDHELYVAGHLIEAAVAHATATGEERLLNVACQFADLLVETFGPDGIQGYPGHPEVELALMRLYELTGDSEYLDLASYFIDERGREKSYLAWEVETHEDIGVELDVHPDGPYDGRHRQDHRPLREQTTPEGHAVRAMYLFAGAAAVARETNDESLTAALERLWTNTTTRRMYLTGGVGSSYHNEGFTTDFDLPNETSYCESCAAVGMVRWGQAMFRLTREATYLDVVERVLYNAFLASLSLSGDRFFYPNHLACTGGDHPHARVPEDAWHSYSPPSYRREAWPGIACCPPNVARLLGEFPRYLFSQAERTVYVTQYAESQLKTEIDGEPVDITVETDYPWGGTVSLTVTLDTPTMFELCLRIPRWCENPRVTVDAESVPVTSDEAFIHIDRQWHDGDTVDLHLPMGIRTLGAHPAIRADTARVALARGPIVYCIEAVDNPYPPSQLRVDTESTFEAVERPDLLGGVIALTGSAAVRVANESDDPYQPVAGTHEETVDVTAIPYYSWANREFCEMVVWLHEATSSRFDP
ncbi:glycoside hydrolase family 127 protein [Halomarina rubra]|uniref:Glycoside hydrolase family 127 protein n=1 Tax=Halomarina rubra TaxID=2071873 RepID=A0ABD6AQW6_9EURY|nr:beta-L-arabinofuranosidase domain-containing protein [Halomarina rubra]